MFSKTKKVVDNPNSKDQSYDFIIDNTKLDLKSTRIPKNLIRNIYKKDFNSINDDEYIYFMIDIINNHSDKLVYYMYNTQSTGVRYSIHNRLFFVTVDLTSKRNYYNEFKLRLNLDAKEIVINKFLETFNSSMLNNYEILNKSTNKYEKVKCLIIYMVLYKNNKIYYGFK